LKLAYPKMVELTLWSYPGLQKAWKSGRSFPGNCTCSQ